MGLYPGVAHSLVSWPHRSDLHWEDMCKSPPFSPAGSQPQWQSWAGRTFSEFLQGQTQPVLPGARLSAVPEKPGLRTGTKSLCVSTGLLLKVKPLSRVLVPLAYHTHLMILPCANESLTFVSSAWPLPWFS